MLLGRIARSLQFVMPSIVAASLFLYFRSASGFDWFTMIEAAIAFLVAILPLYLFAKTEETSGISLNPEHKSLARWETERRTKSAERGH
jgi:hypothetical protein